MKLLIAFFICLAASAGAQFEQAVVPSIRVWTTEANANQVTVLHLAPGYASSISVPDEVTSVVLGNPAAFRAEHSAAEARLVVFKPITDMAGESNALITTKSGQHFSFQLLSFGKANAASAPVDFLSVYRRPHVILVDTDEQSFLIAETVALSPATAPTLGTSEPDQAKHVDKNSNSVPLFKWQGKQLRGAVRSLAADHQETTVTFSVLNSSQRLIELLPPRLELIASAGKKHGVTRVEPIPLSRYRLAAHLLSPGQQADGAVTFERPPFKEAQEHLQLLLSEAEQIDRPLVLPVPFTAAGDGGAR